ncbi:DUF1700 domain-containing protein [Bombilactobacillus folatiphilus]|uniref:DUF1700 domain-containing protein n=1 Tax=Bombilactobacillus folatiphilus TaxID=2923362 RepID=A0ABY4P832_9LACO|nr:DUF1700 domain-containing protein [Bombilactobacillus folatiphilus]UQS81745.1 DUF1700 domain-containing protein [Bombilactobacillus folatiphilus]
MKSIIKDYLAQLTKELAALPTDERQEVVGFYQEFILDAGFDQKDLLEDELGTPKQLAHKILADYSLSSTALLPAVVEPQNPKEKLLKGGTSRRNLRIVWWIFLGMLAAPIGIPTILVVAALLLAILVVFLAIGASFVAVVLSLFLSSLFIIFRFTIPLLTTNWAVACFYLGIAAIMMAISLLCMPLIIKFARFLTTQCVTFARYLGRKFLKKRYFRQKSQQQGDY